MKYGYCRISTSKQNIERQVRNIKEKFPDAIIVKEAYTGTKIERPEFSKMLRMLKMGDTVVFDSVSRMSRDAEDGFKLYQSLYEQGVMLIFLKEPHINTEVFKAAANNKIKMTGTNADIILEAVNKYLMVVAREQIRIAFEQAEKEVLDLHQRTKEGIETARLNGKQIGQKTGIKLNVKKKSPSKEKILRYSKDFDGVLSDLECMKLVGVSRNTFYKYKRELKQDQAGA
nr:recombinase family protein [uncultured Butyrivibrio sp.]